MTEQEVKQILVDTYINLLRIKAAEKAENSELDIQLEAAKLKLSSYNMDTSKLEALILNKSDVPS